MKMFCTFPQKFKTRNCYTIYEGKDEREIRKQIIADYGDRWSFVYPIDKLDEQVKKFGLVELPRFLIIARKPKRAKQRARRKRRKPESDNENWFHFRIAGALTIFTEANLKDRSEEIQEQAERCRVELKKLKALLHGEEEVKL